MIPTYGTKTDNAKSEQYEMASFFNMLRKEHPKYAAIALHIRNEGQRTHGQVQRVRYEGGFVKGASDIVIPGSPAFVCEMKSQSKTARVSPEQMAYLTAAQEAGAFVAIAFGAQAAWEAFEAWIKIKEKF